MKHTVVDEIVISATVSNVRVAPLLFSFGGAMLGRWLGVRFSSANVSSNRDGPLHLAVELHHDVWAGATLSILGKKITRLRHLDDHFPDAARRLKRRRHVDLI
ncbi:Protein QUIRKY [Senna tora]|uniref:Protein QUIRKY n=1 Tax=Senna tora TaxID=362788 RepID=A0A834WGT9_9FABA|nr:Protein QUIRKY [Senna tora]